MNADSRRIIGALLVPVVGAVLFCGCKKEGPKEPRQIVPQTAKAQGAAGTLKTGEAKPEKPKVETDTYLYDPAGRRDPFLSIIEAAKKDRETEKKKKGIKPSESYDVNEIKVIAIATDKKNRYAMMLFPDNKYFTVREGMTLGRYGGKVTRITEEGVSVREYIKDYKGMTQPKDTILKLRKEEGE